MSKPNPSTPTKQEPQTKSLTPNQTRTPNQDPALSSSGLDPFHVSNVAVVFLCSGAGGCDVVSCVVPIVVIVVLVIAATIVVLFLVRKRRSKSEKYRPTAVDEPEVEVDQNEMKTVPDDAVA